MPSAALNAYLAQLSDPSRSGARLWLNDQGQAEGQFFKCRLTSAFQPILTLGHAVPAAYEAVIRNVDAGDSGHSLWRMLDHAASDDESVELDRLGRMLHAINFFRQSAARDADLYLSVHNRLLSSVSSNHGHAFRRILDALELPVERIVLQLPDAAPNQRWLLGYVCDNYRRNGLRMALGMQSPGEARALVEAARPAALKIDASAVGHGDALQALLEQADEHGVEVIVRRVDSSSQLAQLEQARQFAGLPLRVQGEAILLPDRPLAGGMVQPQLAA